MSVNFDEQILNDLLDEAPPKVNVDCLVVGYYITSESIMGFMRLIDGLLWSCRPNTIFMHCLGFLVQQECIKVWSYITLSIIISHSSSH